MRTFQDIIHALLVNKPDDPYAQIQDHISRAKAYSNKVNGEEEAAKGRVRDALHQALMYRVAEVRFPTLLLTGDLVC